MGNSLNSRSSHAYLLAILLIAGFGARAEATQDDQPANPKAEKPKAEKPEAAPIPEFRAQITAVWPGASPPEIELSLAQPIEQSISSVAGVESVRTRIFDSRCQVTLHFDQAADAKVSMQKVRARLDSIAALPEDADEIQLRSLPPLGTSPLWVVWNPTSEDHALTVANARELRKRVSRLQHVGEVQAYGVQQKILEVVVDDDALRLHGLTFEAAQNAVARKRIQSSGKRPDINALEELTLSTSESGRKVFLRDVAQIRSATHYESPVKWNGQPASALSINTAISARDKELFNLRRQLRKDLPEWQKELNGDGELRLAFPPSGADIRVEIDFPVNTPDDLKNRIVKQAMKELEPELTDCSWLMVKSGGAIEIHIGGASEPKALVQKVHATFQSMPGINVSVANLREAPLPIIAQISGPDLEALRAWASSASTEINALRGVTGIRVSGAEVVPELEIVVDKDKAKQLGIDVATLTRLISPMLSKSELPSDAEMPVVVRHGANAEPADLADMSIRLPDGKQIRISQVASIRLRAAPSEMIRVNFQRAIEMRIQADGEASYQSIQKALGAILLSTRPDAQSDAFQARVEGVDE